MPKKYKGILYGKGKNKKASAIQRMIRARQRRNRLKSKKQTYNQTTNVLQTNIGRRSTKKSSLTARVAALESGAKKHSDYVSLTPELIVWNGTDLNASKASYTSILAIQGPLNTGAEGNAALSDNEQRKSDTIHCQYVRLKGEVIGVRPQDLGAIGAHGTMSVFGAAKMRQLCHSKITITILLDKRPSSVNAVTGEAEVNPLPTTAGAIAIETIYSKTTAGVNQLQFFGSNNALRSYESSRFKHLHSECIETTYDKPNNQFDITYKIDKTLKYVPPRPPPGAPPNPPSLPYNYGLVVFFTCITPPVEPTFAVCLSPPQVTKKTARTYFIDA